MPTGWSTRSFATTTPTVGCSVLGRTHYTYDIHENLAREDLDRGADGPVDATTTYEYDCWSDGTPLPDWRRTSVAGNPRPES